MLKNQYSGWLWVVENEFKGVKKHFIHGNILWFDKDTCYMGVYVFQNYWLKYLIILHFTHINFISTKG